MREQETDQDAVTEAEPAHHARRPMNAFLIFCKRHRSVVRDKYPNLENRSITKILGEWWANLDKEEKAGYTNLAKQYKDAFFTANPDFKWYKLPAPPLRTLSSRPSTQYDKPTEPPLQPYSELDPEPLRNNNNSTKYDYNKKTYTEEPLSMFTPGKLADEAHMGGLSSLISSNRSPTPEKNIYISSFTYSGYTPKTSDVCSKSVVYPFNRSQQFSQTKPPERPNSLSKEDSIRELQNALSETTRIFEADFHTKEETPDLNQNNNRPNIYEDTNVTNQQIINQTVDKRMFDQVDVKNESSKEWTEYDKQSRTRRSCKGKRYQEFMAMGGLIVNKRQKLDNSPDDTSNPSSTWSYNYHLEPSTKKHDLSAEYAVKSEIEVPSETEKSELADDTVHSEVLNDFKETFKPADFDLDAKIKALPTLSLEKFQQKKRENKRKKKTNFSIKPKESRPKYSEAYYTGPNIASYSANTPKSFSQSHDNTKRKEQAEHWREAVIGSQKRKPRKISITRLEINSTVNRTGEYRHETKSSPEIKIATEAPATHIQNMEISKHSHVSADLFALATLAEVAASTSKIDATTISEAAQRNASPI